MIFDPISQWERFKFESLCAVSLVVVILIGFGIGELISKVFRHND